MSSLKVRSVAADSNVLLSAVAGRAARRAFEYSELLVVTTEQNVEEVREYLPEFAARYDIAIDLLIHALGLLPLIVYSERDYAEAIPEAARLVGKRDPDDIALAALALKLRVPIWSNDRDYEGFPTGVFTTARLLKILE